MMTNKAGFELLKANVPESKLLETVIDAHAVFLIVNPDTKEYGIRRVPDKDAAAVEQKFGAAVQEIDMEEYQKSLDFIHELEYQQGPFNKLLKRGQTV